MFKTEQNVPRIYPERSRDFQLLCRLFDACVNPLLGQSDRLKYQLSSSLCDERFVNLLATRIGFLTDEYLPTDVVRDILAVFPYTRKNKGNLDGITTGVLAALKTYSANFTRTQSTNADGSVTYLDPISVEVTNKNAAGDEIYELRITISCSKQFSIDERYLREILKYVLPTGYLIRIVEQDKDKNILSDSYMTL